VEHAVTKMRVQLAEAVAQAQAWQSAHRTLEVAMETIRASRSAAEADLREQVEDAGDEVARLTVQVEAVETMLAVRMEEHWAMLAVHARYVTGLKAEIAERRVYECRVEEDGTVVYPQIGLRVARSRGGSGGAGWSLKVGNRVVGVMQAWSDVQVLVNEKLREAATQAVAALASDYCESNERVQQAEG
jgi:hypothetical protein